MTMTLNEALREFDLKGEEVKKMEKGAFLAIYSQKLAQKTEKNKERRPLINAKMAILNGFFLKH